MDNPSKHNTVEHTARGFGAERYRIYINKGGVFSLSWVDVSVYNHAAQNDV